MLKASGFVEVRGLTAAITVSDIMLKSANVDLVGIEYAKGMGYTVVKIQGEVGAVKAAVDAATSSYEINEKLVSKTIIARPSNELEKLIYTDDTKGLDKKYKIDSKDLDTEIEERNNIIDVSNTSFTDDSENYKTSISENNTNDLDNSSEFENHKEESEENKEVRMNSQDEVVKNETALDYINQNVEKEYTCNLCKDPECERKKGEPHKNCKYYQN